jgi:hypothetical protein
VTTPIIAGGGVEFLLLPLLLFQDLVRVDTTVRFGVRICDPDVKDRRVLAFPKAVDSDVPLKVPVDFCTEVSRPVWIDSAATYRAAPIRIRRLRLTIGTCQQSVSSMVNWVDTGPVAIVLHFTLLLFEFDRSIPKLLHFFQHVKRGPTPDDKQSTRTQFVDVAKTEKTGHSKKNQTKIFAVSFLEHAIGESGEVRRGPK